MTDFNPVSERVNFSQEEDKIFKYWNDIDAFKQQLEKTKDFKSYSFYDGPPFATGLPHYGHITAGTIKDVVTRYASQTGHHVERRFGWDCHGLPVEYEIDKKLGLATKEDHERVGIEKYNAECKSIVMRYSKEWEHIVSRMGRWIDFERDYKTMDLSFMDSVWWVFKQIYDKGLVYRGCKVMPYSMQCTTVLSNFEAGQNYKDVFDPSIYVTFPTKENPKEKFLAWTTTPWTLPSNLALAVHPDFDYVRIKDKKLSQLGADQKDPEEVFIVAECRLAELYSKEKDKKKAYEVLSKCKGKDLVGMRYEPLFDNFASREQDGCFQVLSATYVTKDSGTGVVHQAPAFGEEDYRTCVKAKIIRPDNPVCPVDESGRFTAEVEQYQGIKVKEADSQIKKDLKKRGRMIHETQIKHSYPFCYRSDTPLIYKAHKSWFINVTSLKEDMLANNMKAKWVPLFAQEKRFNNWLANAEDWCFSRNRMWGNPIPLWVSKDFSEVVCVGSVAELEQLSGVTGINDLHREHIDHITIPSQKGGEPLRRIEEVFDCWFESGSMPYAQVNYPKGMNEQEFQKRFPADFISEGIDQTRGWFYTLNVISTALFNSNPYKNLVVNGLVLASDGKKMSKRLQNYPDPMLVVNKLGADAIRLYLINSPLVKGESLNFKEEGVRDVVKDIFLPWYNAYRFLIQNIKRWETHHQKAFSFSEDLTKGSEDVTDRWILAATASLIRDVRRNMGQYDLSASVPKLVSFLEQLTNWYIRLNRTRIKGEIDEASWTASLAILFSVILKSAQMMSPFVPFITDMMYQNLAKVIPADSPLKDQSIHFLQLPDYDPALLDDSIENSMSAMQNVIEVARNLREKKGMSLKQPIQSCSVFYEDQAQLDNLRALDKYIREEVNCAQVVYSAQVDTYMEKQAVPNHKLLGQKLKKAYNNEFRQKVNNLTVEQVALFQKEGQVEVCGHVLTQDDILLKQNLRAVDLPEHQAMDLKKEYVILLDLSQDQQLKNAGLTREFVNRVQKLRKSTGLNIDDQIFIFIEYHEGANGIKEAVEASQEQVNTSIKKPILPISQLQSHLKVINAQKGQDFDITLTHAGVLVDQDRLKTLCAEQASLVAHTLCCYDPAQLKKELKDGKFSVVANGIPLVLTLGQEFTLF